MEGKIVIIDPFIHKKGNLSRNEFLNRIEFVKSIRTREYQLSFYFDSPNKWENIEHFHHIINSGDFSKQTLTKQIPFALAVPELLFKWMKEYPITTIQKQIIFWIAGYCAFNSFEKFVSKELLEPIRSEVLNIVEVYYKKNCNKKFNLDHIENFNEYNKLYKDNIEFYLKTAKTFIGEELPEILKDPYTNPCAFDEKGSWGLKDNFLFEYSISYFSETDWVTIISRDIKQLKMIDINEAKKMIKYGEKDTLERDESSSDMFEKWKYTYKMFELRGTNIFSIYSPLKNKKPKRDKIPQNIIDKVWRRDEGKCAECGSKEKLEIDHIIPISKGGSNTYRNLQLLCENHNRSKHNKIG